MLVPNTNTRARCSYLLYFVARRVSCDHLIILLCFDPPPLADWGSPRSPLGRKCRFMVVTSRRARSPRRSPLPCAGSCDSSSCMLLQRPWGASPSPSREAARAHVRREQHTACRQPKSVSSRIQRLNLPRSARPWAHSYSKVSVPHRGGSSSAFSWWPAFWAPAMPGSSPMEEGAGVPRGERARRRLGRRHHCLGLDTPSPNCAPW